MSNDSLNIAFLMDDSGSVNEEQWGLMTAFVDRIATFDVAGPSYVSLFEFHSLPGFRQFLDWTPVETGKDDISAALNDNSFNQIGLTATWDAVNRVLDEFYDYRQTCDDGCDRRHDVLFLLTDGKPSVRGEQGVPPNDLYRPVCDDMLPRVTGSNVDFVVIGVGDVSAFIGQVSCLDVNDNERDVYVIEDYNATQFIDVERKIRNKTCSGLFPEGPSDREGTNWTYANGNTSLGPVPTTNPDGPGPPNDTNSATGTSLQALVANIMRPQSGTRSSRVLSVKALANLDSFDMFNLWMMALLLVTVNVVLGICCYCGFRWCSADERVGKADFDDDTDAEEPAHEPEDVDF